MQYNTDLTKYFDRYYELSLPEKSNKDRKSMPSQIEKRLYAFKYDQFVSLAYNKKEEELLGISCIPKNFHTLLYFLDNGEYKYTRSLEFLRRIRDALIKYANYSFYKLDRKDYKERNAEEIHTGIYDKTVEDYCFCFNGMLLIPPVLKKCGSILGNRDIYVVDVNEIKQDILYSYNDIFNNIKMSTITLLGKDAFNDSSKGAHNYIYPIRRNKEIKPVGIFGYMTFGFCHSDHPSFRYLPTRDRISFFVNDNGDVKFWHNHVKPLKLLYE